MKYFYFEEIFQNIHIKSCFVKNLPITAKGKLMRKASLAQNWTNWRHLIHKLGIRSYSRPMDVWNKLTVCLVKCLVWLMAAAPAHERNYVKQGTKIILQLYSNNNVESNYICVMRQRQYKKLLLTSHTAKTREVLNNCIPVLGKYDYDCILDRNKLWFQK